MPRRRRIPAYSHHKPTGQARVRLDGRDHYLGPFGSPESKARYDELVAAWLQGRLPTPSASPASEPGNPGLLVEDICAQFLQHAERTYVKRGEITGQVERVSAAFGPLRDLFGRTAAVAFGPKSLKTVREKMVALGWRRTTVNDRIGVIKQAWGWAVSEELLPGTCAHALRAVKSLPMGCGIAPEAREIRPVPWPVVEQTLPHLQPQLADAVRLQYLAGMRPCEALAIRPCDIDQTGQVPDGPCLPGIWVYVVPPEWNKNAHRGKRRAVLLGPAAQELLAPYLAVRQPDQYVFSPKLSREAWHAKRSADRKTPRYPSHMKHNQARRKARPRRAPGEKYDTRAFAHAVSRAAKIAGVPHWAPNQLRHARATEIRRMVGLDQAGTVLGHTKVETSQLYAERDLEAAAELIRRVG